MNMTFDFKTANIITCLRIVCAFALIPCQMFSRWFYIFYAVGGVSDLLDGFAARHFGKETKLGARLDTVADAVFFAAVLIKIYIYVSVPLWITVWICCVALIKCVNVVNGFVLRRQFVSEHTVANKICGILLFAIPPCLGALPWTAALIVMALTCAVATFAAVEEEHYIRIGKEIH